MEKLVDKSELGQIYYYTSQFRLDKNPSVYYKQQQFFKRLRKQQFLVRVSQISETSNHVKGDDIYLAVDMMDDTCQKKFDTAVLVSGDGDFVPLVKRVKSAGKKVELWYFEKGISSNLKKSCNEKRKINRSLIQQCGYSQNT